MTPPPLHAKEQSEQAQHKTTLMCQCRNVGWLFVLVERNS